MKEQHVEVIRQLANSGLWSGVRDYLQDKIDGIKDITSPIKYGDIELELEKAAPAKLAAVQCLEGVIKEINRLTKVVSEGTGRKDFE